MALILSIFAFSCVADLEQETSRPEGEFAQVRLEFHIPGASAAYRQWTYLGTMRSGRMRIDHGIGLRSPGGELVLEDGHLQGRFQRVQGRLNPEGAVEVHVDALVDADGKIEGAARIGSEEGSVNGRLTHETALRERNRIDPAQNWPMFLGPIQGGVSARSGPLADPSDFRLAWRNEEIDIGEGIGSITRFMHTWRHANGIRTSSGSSSPVLADGRIYLSYHVPSPHPPTRRQTVFVAGARPYEQAVSAVAEEAGLSVEELPEHVLEKLWEATDDIVLCMDAETGQTLWKTRMPARGFNMQHHKDGPYNMSPAVADGRVFAVGMDGDLYALDAQTGEPLWTRKIGGNRSHHSAALAAVPGVVIAPMGNVWCGFSAENGEVLWQSAIPASSAAVNLWAHEDRFYLLSGSGNRLIWEGRGEDLVCLDVLTGEEAWRIELPDQPTAVHSAGRGSGPGGISVFGDIMITYEVRTDGEDRGERRDNLRHAARAWRISPSGAAAIWHLETPAHNGEHVPVIMHGKYVVLGAPALLKILSLETGALVSQHKGPGPGNGGYMQAMGDLLMVRPDGTHGHPHFHFYRVDPDGEIEHLTPQAWQPGVSGGTSSYHHPIYYPMADGRIFLRLADGIHAFDLRSPIPE
ncbi:MAG: PQQ-like beta-propeller repeat protein [Kiritimatiellae bacterium]|nr:PQQ-like beta-propeller repeat protein [Kiritimatiellia bacterium]